MRLLSPLVARRIAAAKLAVCRPIKILFEQSFRRDREAIGDVRRAIEDPEHVIAQGAAKFALVSTARYKRDTAKAGVAFGADDVASSHGWRLCRTTVTVPRRRRFTKRRVVARLDSRVIARIEASHAFAGSDVRLKAEPLIARPCRNVTTSLAVFAGRRSRFMGAWAEGAKSRAARRTLAGFEGAPEPALAAPVLPWCGRDY